MAFSTISLDDVKRIKRAVDTTVNDVVLAVCTGALRRYLIDGDELPDDPLVATVPVSTAPKAANRRGRQQGVGHVRGPARARSTTRSKRLQAIREGTKGAKEEHNALGADVLLDWAEHATPNVFSAAARAYTRFRLADQHRPIHSLVISNVPGTRLPHLLGAVPSSWPASPWARSWTAPGSTSR